MRKIVFKGKHDHVFTVIKYLNGRWIEGYLSDEDHINSPELKGEFLIDKDTLCQYTGLLACWNAFDNEPQENDILSLLRNTVVIETDYVLL